MSLHVKKDLIYSLSLLISLSHYQGEGCTSVAWQRLAFLLSQTEPDSVYHRTNNLFNHPTHVICGVSMEGEIRDNWASVFSFGIVTASGIWILLKIQRFCCEKELPTSLG